MKIKDEASVRYSLGVLYIYFLEDPKRGSEHLRAGLTDATASEELKAAIKQELERPPPWKKPSLPPSSPMPRQTPRRTRKLTKRQTRKPPSKQLSFSILRKKASVDSHRGLLVF